MDQYSLPGHVAPSLTLQTENLATTSLLYLLRLYRTVHEAFVEWMSTMGYVPASDLQVDTRVRIQVGSIPDLVGAITVSRQRARRIEPEDCHAFDYMLTRDEENYRAVAALCAGSAVVRPFLDFAADSPEREVPDPYYGGPDGFERVLDLVEEASEGLLEDIRKHHLSRRA